MKNVQLAETRTASYIQGGLSQVTTIVKEVSATKEKPSFYTCTVSKVPLEQDPTHGGLQGIKTQHKLEGKLLK